MEQALIRRLKDGTLADYRRSAKANGRSLEAELRDVIERNRPSGRDIEALAALSQRLRAMTPPSARGDSTPYIRWSRDTNGGDWGEPFDPDASRP